MPAYYVETSALLKRYRLEPGPDVVQELFAGKRADELLTTSQLTVLEFHAMTARMLRGRLLRRPQYDRLLLRLLNDLATYDVQLIPVSEALVDEAVDLFPEYPLRTADALHLATAVRVSREVGDDNFYLVSGDKDITDVCRQYPLRVIDPEEPTALGYLHGLR